MFAKTKSHSVKRLKKQAVTEHNLLPRKGKVTVGENLIISICKVTVKCQDKMQSEKLKRFHFKTI